MPDGQTESQFAATCHGVGVPPSRYLHDGRIERINAGAYEGDEIRGALSVVGPEDTVLEIGAGIGVVGGVIAHNCKPRRVLSFEANPELIDEIRALHTANGLTGISVENAVLFSTPDRPAKVPFFLHKSYLGSSLTNPGRKLRKKVKVPTRDFDSVCAGLDPTVLIMDIEGGELDILEHADLSRFRAIVLEFHPAVYGVEGMRRCKSILRKAGLRPVSEVSTRTVWTCTRDAPEADTVSADADAAAAAVETVADAPETDIVTGASDTPKAKSGKAAKAQEAGT
ncbi:MAG: FkbM family methyltransferase [Rhodobacteraceae bacterium]|nr:FkbM family methyltransferase [Paracoccaceae bacterium]